MTTKRPYAPARSAYDAVRELNSLSGTLFQKELVEQFVQAIGMFPTGSLVELNTGEIAVVTAQNRVQRLQPMLRLLSNADKMPLAAQKVLDLRSPRSKRGGESDRRWISPRPRPWCFRTRPEGLLRLIADADGAPRIIPRSRRGYRGAETREQPSSATDTDRPVPAGSCCAAGLVSRSPETGAGHARCG